MYQRVGATAFKKGLGNTRALLKSLDHPERQYPAIHVAGTNGKGTVSHLMASCYQAKGLKVGLYTSPHFRDFRERVKINGEMISKREVTNFVKRIAPVIEQLKPSFFEITVALAFDAFARHRVDVAVIETGLGGRLDSTNVITPVVSVITNISFDHMAMLGNTLQAIAREKAGIIKNGVPAVVGEYQRSSAEVFKKVSHRQKSRLSFANRTLQTTVISTDVNSLTLKVSDRSSVLFKKLQVGAYGPFLQKNTTTALQALRVAGDENAMLKVGDRHIRRGLQNLISNTKYQGRWQMLAKNPTIIADSAHNAAGLAITTRELKKHLASGKLHCVLGFVNDKDVGQMLSHFPTDAQFYFAKPDVPRGMDVDQLVTLAAQLGMHGNSHSSVIRALRAAKKQANIDDLIFVGGSTFVVAEVV